jgi:hypothetical protein
MRVLRLVGSFLLVTLSACLPRVRTDFDPEVSFRRLNSYAWVDSSGVDRKLADEYPFLERRLRRAVDGVLESRGFRRRETGDVDFLVTVFVVTRPREGRWGVHLVTPPCGSFVSVHIGPTYPFGISRARRWYRYPAPYFRSPWGFGCAYRVGFGYVWLPMYDEPDSRWPGTLIIDIIDPRTHDLMWRATAEGAILDLTSPGDQASVDETVAKILRDFPPPGR